MSLFGALFTGVSALGAQSQALGTISNNIANVNTTAYKRSEAQFASMVTASGRSAAFSPGGVRANQTATVNQQGLLEQTSSTTDIGISGNGFFVVQREATGQSESLWTRAGSFSEDSRGFLRNTSGFYLMGWPLDASGNLPLANADVSSLQPVDVAFLGGLTRPTTDSELVVNLDARQDNTAPNPHFTRAMRVYDSLGEAQDLTFEFNRTAAAPATDWNMVIQHPGGPTTVPLVFTGTGTLDTADPAVAPLVQPDGTVQVTTPAIDWGNGSNPQAINIDITNFTQFSGEYNVAYVNQNGAELGLRTGVSIDRDGFVVASFSNGQTTRLYKLPIATFANPNGLESLSGNVFRQSIDSGDYNLREAGQGGAGEVAPNALEASNVDLADEFSRMIITQRAYSAGTKVMTTSDQMLTELLNIR